MVLDGLQRQNDTRPRPGAQDQDQDRRGRDQDQGEEITAVDTAILKTAPIRNCRLLPKNKRALDNWRVVPLPNLFTLARSM